MRLAWLLFLLLLTAARIVLAWDLPADRATVNRSAVAEILAGRDYLETSSYTQRIDFIDFSVYGQPFTQAVVTLTPDKRSCTMAAE